MLQPLAKVRHSIRAIGWLPTMVRAARYARFALRAREQRRRTRELISAPDLQSRFTRIYEANHWGSSESASGEGSTLAYTARLRAELPALLARFGIRRVFDAPCGDFNWMREVLKAAPLDRYTGADIVAPMIESLVLSDGNETTRFLHLDITRGPFPQADLWICRDCLFHLSFADIRRALEIFVASGIPYLLTTTHANPGGYFLNTDIRSGDFRRIDLFAEPFNLPRNALAMVDDWHEPEPPRQMCLWSADQVRWALSSWPAR